MDTKKSLKELKSIFKIDINKSFVKLKYKEKIGVKETKDEKLIAERIQLYLTILYLLIQEFFLVKKKLKYFILIYII
jgi:hypothetical protein